MGNQASKDPLVCELLSTADEVWKTDFAPEEIWTIVTKEEALSLVVGVSDDFLRVSSVVRENFVLLQGSGFCPKNVLGIPDSKQLAVLSYFDPESFDRWLGNTDSIVEALSVLERVLRGMRELPLPYQVEVHVEPNVEDTSKMLVRLRLRADARLKDRKEQERELLLKMQKFPEIAHLGGGPDLLTAVTTASARARLVHWPRA